MESRLAIKNNHDLNPSGNRRQDESYYLYREHVVEIGSNSFLSMLTRPTASLALIIVIHRFLFTFQLVLAIARNATARPDQKNERAIPENVGIMVQSNTFVNTRLEA